MSTHNLPTPPPEQADAQRVAALAELVAAMPRWHRANVYGPACPPVTPVRGPWHFRSEIHPAVRAYVYARDNRTCQGCGAPALPDRNDRPPGGRYITLDHVLEWRRGGCDHAHNLRVMCSTCNPRLGNTGPEHEQRRAAQAIARRTGAGR